MPRVGLAQGGDFAARAVVDSRNALLPRAAFPIIRMFEHSALGASPARGVCLMCDGMLCLLATRTLRAGVAHCAGAGVAFARSSWSCRPPALQAEKRSRCIDTCRALVAAIQSLMPASPAAFMRAAILPLFLAFAVLLTATQRIRARRATRDTHARETSNQQASRVRARFSAALETDSDTQIWVPASRTRKVADLTGPLEAARRRLRDSGNEAAVLTAADAVGKRSAGQPAASASFPPDLEHSECGVSMTVSFRAAEASTSHAREGQASQPRRTASSAAAADAQGSPTHPQHSDQDRSSIVRGAPAIYSGEDDAHEVGAAGSDDDDGSAFYDDGGLPFEIDEHARREYQRFARNTQLSAVPAEHRWDISKLQTKRPIPKIYLDV